MFTKNWFVMQVCDIVDGLFVSIFKHLNENCKMELEVINRQYPFEPLKVKHSCLFYGSQGCNHLVVWLKLMAQIKACHSCSFWIKP